jgi:hypothetical protein
MAATDGDKRHDSASAMFCRGQGRVGVVKGRISIKTPSKTGVGGARRDREGGHR